MDASIKGAGIAYLRKKIREKGEAAENRLLVQLSPDEKDCFRTALAVNWIPAHTATIIYQKAIPIVYPDDSDGLVQLGKEIARENFTGMHRLLFSVTTVPFLIGQMGRIWHKYHQKGKPTIVKQEKNLLQFEPIGVVNQVGFGECHGGP